MSFIDGHAALILEMPARVPRTEYSADSHWKLISAVTGISVAPDSSPLQQQLATSAFMKAWNYDFVWNIHTGSEVFGDKRSDMGHAEYAAGAVDYRADVHFLYDDPEDALTFDPWETFGSRSKSELISGFDKDYDKVCSQYSDCVNMTGIYVTCMSGLIEIFGWEILLSAAGIDSRGFGDVTNRYVAWISQYFEALAESKSPVVMIHDDIVWTSGAFFNPQWYREFIFPNYKKLFAPLHDAGKKIIYTSDGNYTDFIDDIAGCAINGFVLEPTTDMQYIADKYGRTHAFIGNADTRILLHGTKDDIFNEVKRCMDIGKQYPGFFMAVGNHIPSNTPVENALYYNECYEKLSRR